MREGVVVDYLGDLLVEYMGEDVLVEYLGLLSWNNLEGVVVEYLGECVLCNIWMAFCGISG